MPYIDKHRRERLAHGAGLPNTAGELNFMFTQGLLQDRPKEWFLSIMLRYWKHWGPSYQIANDIMGASMGALAEYWRRTSSEPSEALDHALGELYAAEIAPYEDTKIAENGDVYEQKAAVQ